jgi:uncharacterized membrane protein
MKESHLRSIIKSLSWRIAATLTTMLIAYFIIGDHEIAIKIGGIEVVVKLLIYYLHERLWLLFPTGTIRKLYNLFK